LYQKIASAIKATVTIHKKMSLRGFFSFAIVEVQQQLQYVSSAAVNSAALATIDRRAPYHTFSEQQSIESERLPQMCK